MTWLASEIGGAGVHENAADKGDAEMPVLSHQIRLFEKQ